jgi:transcription-repair coupling factor (superfamily II helicase)
MGSGFKIAMRDLEIRGAGNLLGGEQHGHMSRIGYDLYCKMIKETVDESLGNKQETQKLASIELKIDAFIPEDYIPNEAVRFSCYRKISDILDKDSMLDVADELKDRFGEMPEVVSNLLSVAYLRTLAGDAGVSVIRQEKGNIILLFPNPDIERISVAVSEFGSRAIITAGRNFAVVLKLEAKGSKILEELEKFLEFIKGE